MALKHVDGAGGPSDKLAMGSYMAESAQLKDYLRQLLADYEPHLVPLEK